MNIQTRINEALIAQQAVSRELSRPAEDVVAPAACFSIKKSLRSILEAYLHTVGVTYSNRSTIDELITLCANNEPGFLTFNFKRLQCSCETGLDKKQSYCTDITNVDECQHLLLEVNEYVIHKIRQINRSVL